MIGAKEYFEDMRQREIQEETENEQFKTQKIMKTQSLFNITEEQRQLVAEIEKMDGELTPEMEKKLELNQSNLRHKAVAYNEVITTKNAQNEMIKAEIKRLQSWAKRNDSIVDRLENNLLNAIKTFGEFEVGLTKSGVRKSTSTEVDANMVNALPKEYKTIKIVETPDKKAIKEALEKGIEIEGCRLSHNLNLKIS